MVQLLLEQRAASRAMFSKDISTSITWRLSELVLDQAHRHEWTFCSWNRSHWNIAIQIVELNGNKSEICCSLHYIVLISMYFFLHVPFTHTDTQIVSLYDVQFWISRKHGPCLRGSPSDAFSHAMELLDSWTSWGSYSKTQGASKAFESSRVSWRFWNRWLL